MKTVVKHLDLPANRRILVVSDIHGNLRAFNAVLEKAGFCDDDILIIEGDFIARCTENLATLRRVMELCERPNVHALTGNVDCDRWRCFHTDDEAMIARLWQTSLDLMDWRGHCTLFDMCEEMGITLNSLEEFKAALPLIREKFRPEFDFIKNLPTVYESEHYIFVHGGLPSDDLTTLGEDPLPYLKNDAFIEKGVHFDRWLVVGHWPCSLYRTDSYSFEPYVAEEQHIIANDGGCGVKVEGQVNLTVLAPEGGKPLCHYSEDDLPKVRALDHQTSAADNVVVSWVTRHLDPVEVGEEFSVVRHKKTGKVFRAPNAMFYGDWELIRNNDYLKKTGRADQASDITGAELYCRDYGDGVLAVEPGDELGLILETSEGIIAKKNSRVGWYRGRYEKM